MAETIRIYVRYETRRKDGTTRREYNERFGQPVPEYSIPDGFDYIWAWFWEINDIVDRAGDGFCKKITASDYLGWEKITGAIVRVDEYAILRAMDVAFCSEMTKEIQAELQRQAEAGKNG